jgi:hypothetical protein
MGFDYYIVFYLSIIYYKNKKIINNIFDKDNRLYGDIITMISKYKPFEFYEYIRLKCLGIYDDEDCGPNKPELLDINLDYKETTLYDMYKNEYGKNNDIKSIGNFIRNFIKNDNIEIISVYLCEEKEDR